MWNNEWLQYHITACTIINMYNIVNPVQWEVYNIVLLAPEFLLSEVWKWYFIISTQEYEINPAFDDCARAQNTISSNDDCSRSLTTLAAVQQSGFSVSTLEQLDESIKTLCTGSCGRAATIFYTECQAKNVGGLHNQMWTTFYVFKIP